MESNTSPTIVAKWGGTFLVVLVGPDRVTEPTIAAVEAALARARDLPDDAAAETLRTAREDLETIRARGDERRAAELVDRIDQRLRAIDERDHYGSELGAAMEPEDEDAP